MITTPACFDCALRYRLDGMAFCGAARDGDTHTVTGLARGLNGVCGPEGKKFAPILSQHDARGDV
jgi:hypothetical protein